MKLAGTYLTTTLVIGLLALLVWGWYAKDKPIPEVVFGSLVGLVGTLVGYVWLRGKEEG